MLQPSGNHYPSYQDEHLTIDFEQQAAILDSQRMILTRKEYDLLALLVQHAGEIIPRDALLMRVWGYGDEIRTRTLDVHVRRLRKNSAVSPINISRLSSASGIASSLSTPRGFLKEG